MTNTRTRPGTTGTRAATTDMATIDPVMMGILPQRMAHAAPVGAPTS